MSQWSNQFALVFLGVLSLVKAGVSFGQSISDCEGAITLCDDFYTETESSFNTGSVYEFTGICNQGLEQSSVWYTFTVQADGLLSFIIDPLNPVDDYDWGLFDITSGGCEGIGSQLLSPEVGCNSYGVAPPEPNGATGISTANGGTGNSNGPGNLNGPPFNEDLQVEAGETYALVVMNWTNSLEGYAIDFGQSTASLYDEASPSVDSLEVMNCENTALRVFLSEFVDGATVTVEDFELVGPTGLVHEFSTVMAVNPVNGFNQVLELDVADPIEISGLYELHITNEAASISDACGNVGEGFIGVELTVLEPPLGWDAIEVLVCPDDAANLSVNAVFQQPENTLYTYVWSWDMAGVPVVGTGPGIESSGDGYYEVVITTSPVCFSATGAFQVVTEECSLTIPNVITPLNGDVLNNAFRVDGLDAYPGSSIRIYDRWGTLLYSSNDFGTTAGWDPGTEEAAEGTYYYELSIRRNQDELSVITLEGETLYLPNGDPVLTLTGSFSLLR
ncbi:MAG: hypothetical protein CL845_04340 [Crocinitomicaceae bacterium]|nr:hypothetical protein [Crocinitomicaceae bacterium]